MDVVDGAFHFRESFSEFLYRPIEIGPQSVELALKWYIEAHSEVAIRQTDQSVANGFDCLVEALGLRRLGGFAFGTLAITQGPVLFSLSFHTLFVPRGFAEDQNCTDHFTNLVLAVLSGNFDPVITLGQSAQRANRTGQWIADRACDQIGNQRDGGKRGDQAGNSNLKLRLLHFRYSGCHGCVGFSCKCLDCFEGRLSIRKCGRQLRPKLALIHGHSGKFLEICLICIDEAHDACLGRRSTEICIWKRFKFGNTLSKTRDMFFSDTQYEVLFMPSHHQHFHSQVCIADLLQFFLSIVSGGAQRSLQTRIFVKAKLTFRRDQFFEFDRVQAECCFQAGHFVRHYAIEIRVQDLFKSGELRVNSGLDLIVPGCIFLILTQEEVLLRAPCLEEVNLGRGDQVKDSLSM